MRLPVQLQRAMAAEAEAAREARAKVKYKLQLDGSPLYPEHPAFFTLFKFYKLMIVHTFKLGVGGGGESCGFTRIQDNFQNKSGSKFFIY